MQKKYIRLLAAMLCLCGIYGVPGQAAAEADASGAIPVRGIVEGFYGTPWTQKDRLSTLEFMHEHNLNLYIYAPKDDPYHREKWREPYPAKEMQRLQELIQTARQNNVEFVFAISPGLDMRFEGADGEADLTALITKFNSLYRAGVRQFAIFFDDIRNKDAQQQANVLNEVNRSFIHKRADVKPLFTVPTEYFSLDMMTKKGIKKYTKDFSSRLDKDILVMYAGEGVVCEGISLDNIASVEKIYGRKMAIWWNYPVSDYMKGKLALGPITGMGAGASDHMAAFVMNPMEHAVLSRITLATGADFASQPASYNEDASWKHALEEQYGALSEDMQVFADHSQRMNNDWAHTGRADAPAVRAHMDALWSALHAGHDSLQEREALQKDFARMETAAVNLQNNLPEEKLAECRPQLALLRQLADADQTVLYLVQSEQEGQKHTADVLSHRLAHELQALPSSEKACLSENTSAAFLQEGLDWYQQQKKHSSK